MSEPAAHAESAPLTIDAAVAQLTPTDPAPVEAAAPEPEQDDEIQAEPTAETDSEPTEATAEEQEAEQAEPETPALDPPPFWDAEGKEAFAKLPREHQESILAQASKQASNASRAIEQAAERAKAAEGQASKVTQLADALNTFLPQAMETFKGRWDAVDWVALARQVEPQEYNAYQAQYQAEQRQLEQLQAANQEAERLAHEQHVRVVNTELPTKAPDLADPAKGGERLGKVFNFLNAEGYAPDRLKHVTAADLAIAYDALRWREAQKGVPQAPAARPKPATPARPAMRPTAAPSSQQQQAVSVQNRFTRSRLSITPWPCF
jgi:uncharacterized phage infection (PIP) family protein YhgE